MFKLMTVFLVWLSMVNATLADCDTINREGMARFNALKVAKDVYKQEFLDEQKKEFSPSSLDRSIASTTKIKIVLDAMIENLLQAQAQNCFGKDAARWAAAIPEFQRQSEELGRSREVSLAQQRAMQDVLKRNSGGAGL